MASLSDEAEVIAAIVAAGIMRRFDTYTGKRSPLSLVVFAAASEVLTTVFGDEENPLKALDEVESLEAALRNPE